MNLQQLIAAQKREDAEAAPSLANIKASNVASKLAEKEQNLNKDPLSNQDAPSSLDRLLSARGNSDSSLDLAEASVYRAGGNLMDALKGISNFAFDTEFDDSQETGLSNMSLADIKAGVSPEYRQKLQADQQKVMDAVARDEYGEAASATADVAWRTLMDSAGVVPELLGGTALTAAGAVAAGPVGAGLGAAVLAKRGEKITKGVTKVFGAYNAAKKRKEAAEKAAKSFMGIAKAGAGKAGKATAQSSLLITDLTQQARNEYKAEYGEEPSPGRVAAMALGNAVTTAWYPYMIKSLYLPKALKGVSKKDFSAQNMRAAYDKQMKALTKYADTPLLKQVAGRVVSGIPKIAKAGGAEAVQEYAQSWAQILSVNVGADGKGLLEGAFAEFNKQGNIDEAIGAAFLGAGAGGAARGAITVPAVAAGATVDAAVTVGYELAKPIEKKIAESGFGKLSDEERTQIKTDYDRANAVYKATRKKNKTKEEILSQANNLEDILTQEEVLNDIYTQGQGADLSDPELFRQAKNQQIQVYKGQTIAAKTIVEAHHYTKLGAAVATKIVKDTVKVVKDLTPDALVKAAEEAAVVAKDLGKAAVEEIRNLDTSGAIGLARVTAQYAQDKSKENWDSVVEAARNESSDQVAKVATIMQNAGQEAVANKLKQFSAEQKRAAVKAGIRKERIVSYDKLEGRLKDVAQRGMRSYTPVAVAAMIADATQAGTIIDDKKTAEALQRSIEHLEKTDFQKNQEDGSLTPDELKRIKKKLDKVRDIRTNKPREAAEGIATNLTRQAGAAIVSAVDTVVQAAKDTKRDWTKKLEGDVDIEVMGTTVKGSQAGAAFIKQLEITDKKIQAMSPEEKAEAINPALVFLSEQGETMANLFDTTDPAIQAEIIGNAMPGVDKQLVMKALAGKLPKEKLKAAKDGRQPSQTYTKKDAGTPVTESGKITVNAEGNFRVEQDLTAEETEQVYNELLDPEIICG